MNKQFKLLIGALLLTISSTHALVLNKSNKTRTPTQEQRFVKEPIAQTDVVASPTRPSEQPVVHTRQSMLHTLESILHDPHPDPASQMSREKHQALLSSTLSEIVSDQPTRSETDQAVSSIIGDTLNAADVLVHQHHFRMKQTHDTVTNLFSSAHQRLSKTLGEEHHSETLHRATYFLKAAQAQVQNRCANIVERTRSAIRWITAGGVITTGALAALWLWLRKRASTGTQDEKKDDESDKKKEKSSDLEDKGVEAPTPTRPTPVVPVVEPDKEPQLEVVKDIATAAHAAGHKISQAAAAVPAVAEGVQQRAQDVGNATNDLVKTIVSAVAGKDAGEAVAEALHDTATGTTAVVADVSKGAAQRAVRTATTVSRHVKKAYDATPKGTAQTAATVAKESAKIAALLSLAVNPVTTTLAGMAGEKVVEHKEEIKQLAVDGANNIYVPTKKRIKALWNKKSPAERAALMAGAAVITYFGASYLVIPATAWGWSNVAVPLGSGAYDLVCGSGISQLAYGIKDLLPLSSLVPSSATPIALGTGVALNAAQFKLLPKHLRDEWHKLSKKEKAMVTASILSIPAILAQDPAVANQLTAVAGSIAERATTAIATVTPTLETAMWYEPYAKFSLSAAAATLSGGKGMLRYVGAPVTWLWNSCSRRGTNAGQVVEDDE